MDDLATEAIHALDLGGDRIIEDAGGGNDGAITIAAVAGFHLPAAVAVGRDAMDFNAVFDREILLGHPFGQVLMILRRAGEHAPMQRELAAGQVAEEARGIQPQRGIEAAPGGRQLLGALDDAVFDAGPLQRVGGVDAGGTRPDHQHIGAWHYPSAALGSAVAVPRT